MPFWDQWDSEAQLYIKWENKSLTLEDMIKPHVQHRFAVSRVLRIVLFEGKNRQIKRMTAAVGHSTVRLVRVAVGPLILPADLRPGEWRDLDLTERKILLDWVWKSQSQRGRAISKHRPRRVTNRIGKI